LDETFYDKTGRPVAYTEDDVHIYLFNGRPVAYFHEQSIYSFQGDHLGWYKNGWIRDNSGRCVFFTEETAGGGPVKPVRYVKPVKHVKHVMTVKSVRHVRPVTPVDALTWSELSGNSFFNQ